MRFPSVSDIATTAIKHLSSDATINYAIEVMLQSTHRNVVVKDDDGYKIFTILDLLKLQKESVDLGKKLCELELKKVPTISKEKNILDTLEFLNSNVEYICVVEEDNSLFGLITHTDITANIDPDTLMDNYRLEDFLKLGRRMKWIKKEDSLASVIQDILHHSSDNVIIVEDMKPIGILTTKDIMLLIKEKKDPNLSVENYMSSPVESICKDSSVKETLSFLNEKKYKRVVVVDSDGRLSGIITQKELISLTYSRWATLMKEYQSELSEINKMLEDKNKEYETRATTDSLTGLYNRYKFSELYLSSYKSMTQRDNDLSLIILDIDLFKSVNDTYGHNIGDAVLVQIAHSLLKVLRNVDIVARWGGEEFVMLLPTASLLNAMQLAEKIRHHVEMLELEPVGRITVSLGVTQVKNGDSMESAIQRADEALYEAKNSGRNCVKQN